MSNYYELSSKSPRDRSIKARMQFVASEIIGLMDTLAQAASEEGWDGREIPLGLVLAVRQTCNVLGIGPDRLIEMMKGMGDAMPKGGKGSAIPLIVAPDGRPLAAPPKLTKIR